MTLTISPLGKPARTARHPSDPRPTCEATLVKGTLCTKHATYSVDLYGVTLLLCGLHMTRLEQRHQTLGTLPEV